ncbi:MAG: response regulator [Desulfatitalea sp.]|nr:response regulator [Desulfatitalea sp.]
MGTFNILLVDDEPEFVESLAERLRIRGFSTAVAPDGARALELIRSQRFQGVVLDVMMPGMDGLETLRQIKKVDASLEVILLTGHARTEVALEGIQEGAFEYLIKPVDIDELSFRLQDACEKRALMLQKT